MTNDEKEWHMTDEELELSGAISRLTMLAFLYADKQPTLAKQIQKDVVIITNMAVKYGELTSGKDDEQDS